MDDSFGFGYSDGRGALLIGQDSGKGKPGVIIDGHVEILVACAAGLAGAVAVDAMAWLDDPRQALDVEVDEVSGALVFVTHDRRRRIERSQPVHAGPAQNAAYRGPAELQLARDPPAVPAQPAKRQNLFY
jgi:hypothetical protein